MADKPKKVFSKAVFPEENTAKRKSLTITVIYLIFGFAWIMFSDMLLDFLISERSDIFIVNIIKGVFYVILTAVLIFRLIYSALKKVTDSEKRLRESEKLFRTIFDQAPIGIAIGPNSKNGNTSDIIPGMNPMFEKITGRSNDEWEAIEWSQYMHPEEPDIYRKNQNSLDLRKITNLDTERRYLKPDGSECWLHVIIAPLFLDDHGNFTHIHLIEDITARKTTEMALLESERSKSVLLENLPGIAYRCNYDREWTMQFISQGCFALTGYKPESLISNSEKSYNDLILHKYREYIWNKWDRVLKAGEKFIDEYEIVTASGDIKWVFEQGQGIYDKDGNVVALEGLIIDITDRKEQELKLKYISEHDTLTGLHNRSYLEALLSNVLKNKENGKRAVLLLYLRKFSFINLAYGYLYGENLIKLLAEELKKMSSENVELFHISIDRFVFYVSDYTSKEELDQLCYSVLNIFKTVNIFNSISGSIGIMEITEDIKDADEILKCVSIAAENASENGPVFHCYFDKEMAQGIDRKESIKNELAKSIDNEEDGNLYLEYQPIVDLKTNRIYGFEALARFKSDKTGFVSPYEFIPIAEESQLIAPLGRKIMHLAFDFLKKIEEAGFTGITMSVNVSSIQLQRDDFLHELNDIIKDTCVMPSNLILEITETVFFDCYQKVNDKLNDIKKMGLRIAIDDFGTGYSSLARERELNISCLKIDKFFIDKLLYLDPEKAISGDIISMAHKLGHTVIAEGVEHEKQKQYLIENGCDLMQGYLFSKPVSADVAVELLAKNK